VTASVAKVLGRGAEAVSNAIGALTGGGRKRRSG
jgi:hypothetical protein